MLIAMDIHQQQSPGGPQTLAQPAQHPAAQVRLRIQQKTETSDDVIPARQQFRLRQNITHPQTGAPAFAPRRRHHVFGNIDPIGAVHQRLHATQHPPGAARKIQQADGTGLGRTEILQRLFHHGTLPLPDLRGVTTRPIFPALISRHRRLVLEPVGIWRVGRHQHINKCRNIINRRHISVQANNHPPLCH